MSGFPKYETNTQIKCYNVKVSIIAYSIFKTNSRAKFDNLMYQNMNLYQKVKEGLMYVYTLLSAVHSDMIVKCKI